MGGPGGEVNEHFPAGPIEHGGARDVDQFRDTRGRVGVGNFEEAFNDQDGIIGRRLLGIGGANLDSEFEEVPTRVGFVGREEPVGAE